MYLISKSTTTGEKWDLQSLTFITMKRHRAIFRCMRMKWWILLGIRITRYKPDTQTKTIPACVCLHNYIRESKLSDQHFDMVENGSYTHKENLSHHFASNDNGNMGIIRNVISVCVNPWWLALGCILLLGEPCNILKIFPIHIFFSSTRMWDNDLPFVWL